MNQPLPFHEDGADRGPSGVCRGAMMGRPGSDPRAVWPWGVLTLEQAEERLSDALAFQTRIPGDYAAEKVAEAREVLDAIRIPYAGRLDLASVPLDDGYDPGGAYWGESETLFCVWSPCRSVVHFIRAENYASATAEVRAEFPGADIHTPSLSLF